MRCRATWEFVDLEAGIRRKQGEIFEVSPDRFKVLKEAGLVTAVQKPKGVNKDASNPEDSTGGGAGEPAGGQDTPPGGHSG